MPLERQRLVSVAQRWSKVERAPLFADHVEALQSHGNYTLPEPRLEHRNITAGSAFQPTSPAASSIGFAEESVRDWGHPNPGIQHSYPTILSSHTPAERPQLRRLRSYAHSRGQSLMGDELSSSLSTPMFTPRLSQLLGPGTTQPPSSPHRLLP